MEFFKYIAVSSSYLYNIDLVQTVRDFLKQHWDQKRPLLLGYSGGPDSKALLYTLLDAGCNKLHLAHIDHGWREESREEAEGLLEEAKRLGLPFHSIRLSIVPTKNQEEAARQERLLFFKALYEKLSCQALLLAHHASDLAETVLKRILEGAHLPYLGGMDAVGMWEAMSIWRPFLFSPRKEILSFLQEKRQSFYQDATNRDQRYLRARMRESILPTLASLFGKEVEENLTILGKRAFEYRSYLDRRVASYQPIEGPWGALYHLSDIERIEARHLLQRELKQRKMAWSRESMERALDAILSRQANLRIESVWIDRGTLFFLKEKLPQFGDQPLQIALGMHQWGDWEVAVEEATELLSPCSWRSIWTGSFRIALPLGSLALPSSLGKFRSLWNQEKVPAFLRKKAPIFWQEGEMVLECLSGKPWKVLDQKPLFQLSFSIS